MPKTGLVALKPDKITIFGTYNNAPEAAEILDNKKDNRYIHRYINKDRLVEAGGE